MHKQNTERKRNKQWNNGFILPVVGFLVKKTRLLSIVELLKKQRHTSSPNLPYINFIIDAFVIAKWIVVLSIIYCGLQTTFISVLIGYLFLTNIFTYFYYHFWDPRLYKQTEKMGEDKFKRRFISLVLSFLFSSLCYSYFYIISVQNFTVNYSGNISLNTLLFSLGNSFLVNTKILQPISLQGEAIVLLQYLVTFVFVTVIFTKSLDNK